MLNEICRQIFWNKQPQKKEKKKPKQKQLRLFNGIDTRTPMIEAEREWTREHVALIKEHLNMKGGSGG
jgi:hypothetical protein